MGSGRAVLPPAKRGGRQPTEGLREILNGVLYVLGTGCQWRALPKDLPPRSTVHHCLPWGPGWRAERLHFALFQQVREQAATEASPTAAIVDSQSVKSAEKGGGTSIRRGTTRPRRSRARSAPSGRHAGPVADRRDPSRRHPGPGRLYPASACGAAAVPLPRGVFADGAYRGEATAATVPRRPLAAGDRQTRRSRRLRGVGEALDCGEDLAWLGRCRRLVKDFENLAVNALAFLCLGMRTRRTTPRGTRTAPGPSG